MQRRSFLKFLGAAPVAAPVIAREAAVKAGVRAGMPVGAMVGAAGSTQIQAGVAVSCDAPTSTPIIIKKDKADA